MTRLAVPGSVALVARPWPALLWAAWQIRSPAAACPSVEGACTVTSMATLHILVVFAHLAQNALGHLA